MTIIEDSTRTPKSLHYVYFVNRDTELDTTLGHGNKRGFSHYVLPLSPEDLLETADNWETGKGQTIVPEGTG